jgi:hypothetical protein
MYDRYFMGRQRYVGIGLCYLRIIPFGNRSQVNSRQGLRREIQLLNHPWNVVDGNIRAERGGKMKHVAIAMAVEIDHLRLA